MNKNNLSICICTYKRPELLSLLIDDIFGQSIIPDQLIIVDGDPSSGRVISILATNPCLTEIYYLPSNHGNLPYQRYLGGEQQSG